MKTSALAAVLGAIALAGVAVLSLEVSRLSDEVAALGRRSAFEERAATKRPGTDEGRIRLDKSARRLPANDAGADRVRSADDAEKPAPVTLEERIARLERAEKQRQAGPGGFSLPGGRALRTAAPVSSVDALAKTLRLTRTQTDRVAAAVARGRQRIEDVLRIPDETGKSPYERRKEQRAKLRDAIANNDGGGILTLSTGLFAGRDRKIPGRNTTYRDEVARIRQETREEIGQALDAEQKERFQDANIDPMLGGGGTVAMTVWSSETASGEEGESDGRILVGGLDVEVEAETEGAPEAKDGAAGSPDGG